MSVESAHLSRAERKRAEQAAELRAEIVDAAFAEFAEKGYHQTTIADIAGRLDVSSGTIYNYHKNKRDIVDHVVAGVVSQLMGTLADQNAPGTTQTLEEYHAQALRIAEAVDAVFHADARIPRVLLLEATSIDGEMTEQVLGMFDAVNEIGRSYFDDGVKRGFFRPDLDLATTADLIAGIIIAAALRNLRTPLTAAKRKAWREAAIGTLLNGIAATF